MVDTTLPLVQVPIVDYGDDEDAMVTYRERGTARALELDNRGPIRFGSDGRLHSDILDSYSRLVIATSPGSQMTGIAWGSRSEPASSTIFLIFILPTLCDPGTTQRPLAASQPYS